MDWSRYPDAGFYDEIVSAGSPRPELAGFGRFLSEVSIDDLLERQEAAELAVRAMGITFTVYARAGQHRPGLALRRAPAGDRPPTSGSAPRPAWRSAWWRSTSSSTTCTATQKIVADGVVPGRARHAARPTSGPSASACRPPFGVWAHICGSDLVRDGDGTLYVLEDNLRVPSGVSYMLENRLVTKRVFAELFRDLDIHPVDDYPHAAARAAGARCRPARASGRPSACSPPASSTRLLRARLPGPADGRAAGRGQRPVRRATTWSTCAPSTARSASTCSTAASTTSSSTPTCSAPTRCSACPASCGRGGPATWPSPTPPARAWPTTRSSTPTCPT